MSQDLEIFLICIQKLPPHAAAREGFFSLFPVHVIRRFGNEGSEGPGPEGGVRQDGELNIQHALDLLGR